eukprot:jgi/Chlat1/3620/Chrsp237S03619
MADDMFSSMLHDNFGLKPSGKANPMSRPAQTASAQRQPMAGAGSTWGAAPGGMGGGGMAGAAMGGMAGAAMGGMGGLKTAASTGLGNRSNSNPSLSSNGKSTSMGGPGLSPGPTARATPGAGSGLDSLFPGNLSGLGATWDAKAPQRQASPGNVKSTSANSSAPVSPQPKPAAPPEQSPPMVSPTMSKVSSTSSLDDLMGFASPTPPRPGRDSFEGVRRGPTATTPRTAPPTVNVDDDLLGTGMGSGRASPAPSPAPAPIPASIPSPRPPAAKFAAQPTSKPASPLSPKSEVINAVFAEVIPTVHPPPKRPPPPPPSSAEPVSPPTTQHTGAAATAQVVDDLMDGFKAPQAGAASPDEILSGFSTTTSAAAEDVGTVDDLEQFARSADAPQPATTATKASLDDLMGMGSPGKAAGPPRGPSSAAPAEAKATLDPVDDMMGWASAPPPAAPAKPAGNGSAKVTPKSSVDALWGELESEMQGVSISSETFVEDETPIEGEPEERRLLRQQRKARVKQRQMEALMEKQKREAQAVLEQEQKRKMHDALGSDIKLWGNKNKNNIRAMLGSLHDVLWEGSGWKPVMITELISTDAVKKVYRRSNLVIHPDKVAQRGCTVEQQFIAEQVFNLMQGAWKIFEAQEIKS